MRSHTAHVHLLRAATATINRRFIEGGTDTFVEPQDSDIDVYTAGAGKYGLGV